MNSFCVVKSNSSFVALCDTITFPVAVVTMFSNSESPGQLSVPSLKVDEFGPGAFNALPVESMIPDESGNNGLILLNDPIPLTDPKLVPVLEVIFDIATHGLLTKTFVTNCAVVNCVVLVCN